MVIVSLLLLLVECVQNTNGLLTMNLQMKWRICFREGWFKKYTCFLVLVDLWMVYIQPNRALRLLFQIFTTWPGFPQRAQYWFLPIPPPGGKMCSGMITKCKVQLKANRKKLSTRHLENVSAVELRWNWMQGSTTFGQTLPISDNLSACTLRKRHNDPNYELSKNCPLFLFGLLLNIFRV